MLHLLLAAAVFAAPSVSLAQRAQTDSVRADGEVRAAVLRNAGDVRRCYEREGLARDPKLEGTIEVSLTILPTGQVDTASIVDTKLRGEKSPAVGQCIVRAVRNWRFERGPYVTETVVFPFNLAPVVPEQPDRVRMAQRPVLRAAGGV